MTAIEQLQADAPRDRDLARVERILSREGVSPTVVDRLAAVVDAQVGADDSEIQRESRASATSSCDPRTSPHWLTWADKAEGRVSRSLGGIDWAIDPVGSGTGSPMSEARATLRIQGHEQGGNVWESVLQGTVAAAIALLAPVIIWWRQSVALEKQRREERLEGLVAAVRSRAFEVAAAAEAPFERRQFYRPLIRLAESIFDLSAALTDQSPDTMKAIEGSFSKLGDAATKNETLWWTGTARYRRVVVTEAMSLAATVQAWHVKESRARRR